MDYYTKAPELSEYELSAYVLDCTAGMPAATAVAALPDWLGQALIMRTGNEEAYRYGSEAYFKAETFLTPEALAGILSNHPQLIIIDSHSLGPSGAVHKGIDQTCEAHNCHVIDNANLVPAKGVTQAQLKILVDLTNISTGKPCQVFML